MNPSIESTLTVALAILKAELAVAESPVDAKPIEARIALCERILSRKGW
jgi:hypothetical protein